MFYNKMSVPYCIIILQFANSIRLKQALQWCAIWVLNLYIYEWNKFKVWLFLYWSKKEVFGIFHLYSNWNSASTELMLIPQNPRKPANVQSIISTWIDRRTFGKHRPVTSLTKLLTTFYRCQWSIKLYRKSMHSKYVNKMRKYRKSVILWIICHPMSHINIKKNS
jgi:hypothetical protein